MADFRADITADISSAVSKINELKKQVESISKTQIKPNISGDFGSKGSTAGKQFTNSFNSALNQIKAQTLSNNIETWMAKNKDAANQFSRELSSMFTLLQTSSDNADSIRLVSTKFQELASATKEYQATLKNANNEQAALTKSSTLSNNISSWAIKNKEAISQMGKEGEDVKEKLNSITESLKNVSNTSELSKIINDFNELKSKVDSFKVSLSSAESQQKALTGADTLSNSLQTWVTKNKEAISQMGSSGDEVKTRIDALKQSLASISNASDLSKAQTEFKNIQSIIESHKASLSSAESKQQAVTNASIMSDNLQTWATKNKSVLDQMGSAGDEVKARIDALKQSLSSISDASGLSKAQSEFKSIQSEVNSYKASLESAKTSQETLTKSSTLSNKIEDWMNKNKRAASEYGDKLTELQNKLKNNSDPSTLKSVLNEFQRIKSEAQAAGLTTDSFFTSLTKFGGQLIGVTSAYTAIRKIIDVCKDGVEAVQQLDEALTNISYTMNVPESDLSNIGNGAMQMATDLGSSATDVLEAVKLYANANESADSILSKAKVATMLGNVTGMSGSESAKSLQTVMNQFGLDQSPEKLEGSLYRVSDALQAVSRNMSYDFSDGIKQMTEGIEASGSVASNAGMSVEEYASMIGLLVEKTGQQGGQLGRSLSTIFQRTTKAGKMEADMDQYLSKSEESLAAIGVKVRNSKGDFRDTLDILGDLAGKWNELDEVERSNISYNMAGIRQSNVLNTLMKNWGEYKHLLGAANDAEGTTLETQEIYAESLNGKLEKLKSTWFEIANQTLDSGGLKSAFDILTQLSEVIGEIGLLPTILGSVAGGLGLNSLVSGGLFESFQTLALFGSASGYADAVGVITGSLPSILAVVGALTLLAKGLDNAGYSSNNMEGNLKSARNHIEKYNEATSNLNEALDEQKTYREQLLQIADKYKDQMKEQGIEIKDYDSIDDIVEKLQQLKTLTQEDYKVTSDVQLDNTILEDRIRLLEILQQKEKLAAAEQYGQVLDSKTTETQSTYNKYNKYGQKVIDESQGSYGFFNGNAYDKTASYIRDQKLALNELSDAQQKYSEAIRLGNQEEATFQANRISNLQEAQANSKLLYDYDLSSLQEAYQGITDSNGSPFKGYEQQAKDYLQALNELQQAQQSVDIQEKQMYASQIDELSGVNLDFDFNSKNLSEMRDTLDMLKQTQGGFEKGSSAYEALDQLIQACEKEYTLKLHAEGDFDDVNTSISQLNSIAEENGSDLKIKINPETSSLEDITSEIERLENLSPEVKAQLGIEGQEKLDEVISKIQESYEFRVQTYIEDGGLESTISNLKSRINELKKVDVNADVQGDDKVKQMAGEIASLPSEVKVAIGLSGDADVKSVISSLTNNPGSVKIPVDYQYPAVKKTVENATQRVTYQYDTVVTTLPSATQVVYRSYKDVNYTGTAQMSGVRLPSYANGSVTNRNIAVQHDGMSLVNELGQESIISRANGSWSLIPGGMRFVKLHKGDIVLNHLQTRSLIRDGQIKSLKTPSFANGSISNVKASVSLTSPLENTASVVNAVNKNKSSEDKSDYDWIEVAIDRIKKAIDKLKNTADSAYKVISKRITSTYDQIVSINNQIEVQQKAYEKYMEKANSIALSDDLKKAVQLGSLNIAEYDSDTKQLIDDYKNWLDKANELKDGISDLHDGLGSLYADAFEKVEEDYENQLKLISHLANTYKNELDLLEEKGYLGGAVFYKAMQNSQQSTIDTLKKELEDLMYEYSLAMTSGEIEEYSEQWYDFNIKINDVKEDLQDANKELVKINNNLRDLEWDIFDYAIDRIETLNDEADFLIELLSENDLFDENGNITNDGLATMSLHTQSYASYMNQASTYANELLNINNQLADNPYDTELIKRKEKLVKAQQDAIKSANKEKKSIVDLTKEGYNNQINSLKELISTYKESLDSSKSLYEYQQKIEEKSSKVAKLQKQLSAYSNDTSLETRATVQKLKLELEDAQKDLQETEYDQFISDSKKLLDDLSSDYEDFLNERLDDTNAILESAITQVDESALQICDAITNATENVGYVLSDSITNVLSNIGIVGSINSVNSELNGIKSAVFKMAGINDDSYANAINGISSSNAVDSSVGKLVEDKPVVEEVVEEEKTNTVDDTTKRKVAAAIWHGVGGWGNGARKGSERYDKLVEVFGENNGIQDLINQGVGKTDKDGISSYSYSAMRKKFKGYRTGGIVDYTGLAMVHGSPGTPETFFDAEDSKNIITLIDVLRQQSTKNLLGGYGNMNSVSLNGILDNSYINDYLSRGSGIVQNNVGDININIPIDHVENYDDIVNEMTKDDKFASFIRSITIDPLTGQSTIRKNIHRW